MMILLMLSLMNVYTALSLSCLLLCSSCMMYHVFIMFLWLVFIYKLHDDNSVHVFTTVFIMYDESCIYGVYTFIHSFR